MKYLSILALILVLILSCKSFRIEGNAKRCFNKKEAILLNRNRINFKIISITPIVTNKNNCIGLYKYSFINNYLSTGVYLKLLKFENEVYSFDNGDSITNLNKITDFTKTYSNYFTKTQIDSIKTEFLKGNEVYGRLY